MAVAGIGLVRVAEGLTDVVPPEEAAIHALYLGGSAAAAGADLIGFPLIDRRRPSPHP